MYLKYAKMTESRSSKPAREFSDETKIVIYHLQEALLDIIDLNLGHEELKVAVCDYLTELLEAGPAYIEVEKVPYRQSNGLGRVEPAGSSKQCPSQHSGGRLEFPFTGRDPRASVIHDDVCRSPSKLPLKLTPPPTLFTPRTNFRYQSDPVSRVHQKPPVGKPVTRSAYSYSQTGHSLRGSNVRRNLFSSKGPDPKTKPTFASVKSPDRVAERHDISDYIEEFEKYLQHKYSSSKCTRDDVNEVQSSSSNEMPDCVAEGSLTCDRNCQPSRFQLFLQKASADMESLDQRQQKPPVETQLKLIEGPQFRDCETDEALGEELAEDEQREASRFEQFVRDSGNPQDSSDSAESMTDEEFYRELLRVELPKK